MKATKRSLPNFSDVAALQWRHDLPQGDKPDLSGALLLSTATLPPLFSEPLLPIFCTLLILPLFKLVTQAVLFLSTLRTGPLSQYVFWLIEPCSAYYPSQRNWHLR